MPTYQILSYVSKTAERTPALCAWYGDEPRLCGLGASTDGKFSPWPFVFSFPDDADQVWVFAEWVASLNLMLRDGASATEVAAWLKRSNPPTLVVEKEAAVDNLEIALAELPVALPSARGMREAMKFLLKERGLNVVGPSVSVEPPNTWDLVAYDSRGHPQAFFEFKTWPSTPSEWSVHLRSSDGPAGTFKLQKPDGAVQLQVWLDALAKSPRSS